MIETLEEKLDTKLEHNTYSIPAVNTLFKRSIGSTLLDDKKADIFRRFVPMVLWAMKRSRPDCETAVSFLMKRVIEPIRDCLYMFTRLMSWIQRSVEDRRIIGADDLIYMLTMTDSVHAVHEDMKGHTGGAITSKNPVLKKMNGRSSTETEQIGTSEYLPKNIYFEMFMEGQGYKLKSNISCKKKKILQKSS